MMNTPCKASFERYPIEGNAVEHVTEEFPAVPQGAYSALGFQNPEEQGLLFIRRLTTHGTCLIQLLDMAGNDIRIADPNSFGRTWDGTKWVNE